jgi:hypothetical protein
MTHSFRRYFLLLAAAVWLSGCGGPPMIKSGAATPLPLPAGHAVGTIALGPFVTSIDPVSSSVSIQYSWFKKDVSLSRLSSDARLLTAGDMRLGFERVFAPLGYKLVAEESSVFKATAVPDMLLGGRMIKVNANSWHPYSGSPDLQEGRPIVVKGRAVLDITWEVLEVSSQKVIFTRTVPGQFEADGDLPGGLSTLILNAYVDSLKGLAAEPAFRDAVLNAKPVDKRGDATNRSS